MKKTNITRTITSLLVAAAMLGVTSCGQSDNCLLYTSPSPRD